MALPTHPPKKGVPKMRYIVIGLIGAILINMSAIVGRYVHLDNQSQPTRELRQDRLPGPIALV
ncbi:MAG: hypothetical protein AB7L09_21560 [Nitrospira sp.]